MILYIDNSTLRTYQNCPRLKINLPKCLSFKITCEYILKGGNIPLTMLLILRAPHNSSQAECVTDRGFHSESVINKVVGKIS